MRRRGHGWLLFALLLATGAARAAEPGDDAARGEAKERFSRGLHLFENGDNGGALAEFKRAYELVPNRLVLYNIALVYASMGKPVEAVDSLEKVLADPGPLKDEYLARARVAKDEQERRIGQLEVQVNVPAAVEVDGVKVGDAPLAAPLRVAAGEHVVGALAPGYLPVRQTTTVAGLAIASLVFDLQPTEARLAHMEIRCPVPGADVLVDGAPVGKTPLVASVAVAPGTRVIEIRRAGYLSARREISLSDGARGEVALDLDEDAQASGGRGRLRLAGQEGDVLVTIDGRTRGVYQQAIELPAGPHVVKLEQAGFESLERLTEVPAGGQVAVMVALRPTPETRAAYLSRSGSLGQWAYGALMSGVVVAGGSTALALWSNGKLSSAESALAHVQQDAVFRGNGRCDQSYALTNAQIAACQQRMTDAQNNVDRYRNLRTVGIIGGATGVALIAAGVILWPPSLRPVLVAGPDGPSLWLHGRF